MLSLHSFRVLFPVLLFSTLCACSPRQTSDNTDWPLHGGDYSNQRYSTLDQINSDNIKNLKLAWKYSTGKKATFQTSPIIVNGTMYLTTPYNDLVALDAATGEEKWRYRHDLQREDFCCGPANRGPAVADDKVFMATIDSRLIALDARTGKKIWDKAITDPDAGNGEDLQPLLGVEQFDSAIQTGKSGYSASMAPQVYAGKVFVGITGAGYGLHVEVVNGNKHKLSVGGFASGDHGLRGFLVAYDANTGEELWRWYSVPENGWEGVWAETTANGVSLNRDIAGEKERFTQYKDTWRYGGGSIWSTPAIDPDLGLIYFGTGNPSPNMEDTTRPGDNLYTSSLVALDIDTGELAWYYQQIPHDRWGYDVASPPVLFDFKKNGRTIKAVGQASKLGWFFVHDRRNGELLLRSEPFIQQENLFAQPDAEGVRIVPGTLGAASWSPVAYNPHVNSVFITGIYQPSLFHSIQLEPGPGLPWQSYTYFKKTDEPDWGILAAVSTIDGRVLWQKKVDQPLVGGALTTAGDLVFTGEGNGSFNAFSIITGEKLWSYQADYGVNAPPVTYAVNGRQYIAVAVGGNRIFGYPTGDDVLVFSLN